MLAASIDFGSIALAAPPPGAPGAPAPGGAAATTPPATPMPPTLPAALVSGPTVSAADPTVHAFVTQAAAALAGDDTTARTTWRNALINATTPPGVTPSSAFLFAFAKQLNDALLPLANNPNVTIRLNAAVAAAKVAERAENNQLAPLAAALLNDKAEGVLIWALRLVRHTLPYALQVNQANLVPAVAPVVQAHPSGAIVLEGYLALMLNYTDPTMSKIAPNQWKQMVSSVLPELLKLFRFRLGEYVKGIPPEPGADGEVALFLQHPRIWPQQTKDQQKQTVQGVIDLLVLSANRADGAQGSEKAQLLGLTKYAARVVMAIADLINAPNLKAAAQPLANAPAGANLAALVGPVQQAAAAALPGLVPTTMPAAPAAPATTSSAPVPAPALVAPTTQHKP